MRDADMIGVMGRPPAEFIALSSNGIAPLAAVVDELTAGARGAKDVKVVPSGGVSVRLLVVALTPASCFC